MISRARTVPSGILWMLVVFDVAMILGYRYSLGVFTWEIDHWAMSLFGVLFALALLLGIGGLSSVALSHSARLELDGDRLRVGVLPGRWSRSWTLAPEAASGARVVDLGGGAEVLPSRKLRGFHGFDLRCGRWRLADGREAYVVASGDRAVYVPFSDEPLLFSAADPDALVGALHRQATATPS